MAELSKRSFTAAELAADNPVLPRLHIQFESDTGEAKVGDGSTAWNTLPYLGAGASGVAGLNGVTAVWQGTQTEYNGLTPDAGTVYFIVEE